MDAGIPQDVMRFTRAFRYNDLASVEALFSAHPERIACVILEAEKDVEPARGFLTGLRDLCDRHGALLIIDEMITGFRWPQRSAQRHHGIEADLSTFGKALGNGFAVSALVGKREVMRLGGLDHDRDRVFLLVHHARCRDPCARSRPCGDEGLPRGAGYRDARAAGACV